MLALQALQRKPRLYSNVISSMINITQSIINSMININFHIFFHPTYVKIIGNIYML